MKLSPFKLYVNSLAHGPVRLGYLEKEDALLRLKRMTGEDFGYDVGQWRDWGRANPEIAEGKATWAAQQQDQSDASQ